MGKPIVVKSQDGKKPIAHFVTAVKPGESLHLDVANRQGDMFTLMELTDGHREWLAE